MADKPTATAASQHPRQEPPTFDSIVARTSPQPSSPVAAPPVSSPVPRAIQHHQTMAAPSASSSNVQKKTVNLSSLMSPPEPAPFDNFNYVSASTPMRRKPSEKGTFPNAPLSPPVSPFTKGSNCIDPIPTTNGLVKDPILYPPTEASSSPPAPLFSPEVISLEARRVVDDHVAARPASLFRRSAPPQREDYELALFFKSAVMRRFYENPRGWLRKERELLIADRRAGAMRNQRLQSIAPAARNQGARAQGGRVVKPRVVVAAPARKNAGTAAGAATSPRAIRVNPHPPKAVRPQGTVIRRLPSAPPESRSRPVAPNREDKDFASLPDYCPPLSSLQGLKANSLKVDWKGNALDLSRDPFANLLHPDELLLAAGLRLDCATYLTSKRRIFQRRLECARIRKEFRKTDAQQACKIDVNKASKLWTAYEKVGWLDRPWMDRFL